MADFVVELPQKPSHQTDSPEERWWVLHVDVASRASDFGIGLILQSPTRELLEQAIWLDFPVSNKKTEYEAILPKLDNALTLAAIKLKICSDSQLVIGQIQKEYEANDERMTHYLTLVQVSLTKLSNGSSREYPKHKT